MRFPLPIRLLIAVAVSLGLTLLLVLLLHLTDLVLSVWERLERAPWWFTGAYLLALLVITSVAGWVVWRLLFKYRRATSSPAPRASTPPRSIAEVQAQIVKAEAIGADATAARAELTELTQRHGAGMVYVALFGQVNVGKSSIVQALLPQSRPEVQPVAGTTRHITRYTWRSPAGDTLLLTDLPGLQEPDGSLDQLAREEAVRAHVVVYLVDGDLTRDQHRELQALLALDKPVILAMNKADRYSIDDRSKLIDRLRERVEGAQRLEVVMVSAARTREVVRVHPDGREELVTQSVPPRVEELVMALQRLIDKDQDTLHGLRDAAVFTLATGKLEQAVVSHRKTQAERIVADYTRKAVLGALAAVSPGTDVVIQGYLGIQLVKELLRLYDMPAEHIDVQQFLGLAARRVRKALPITLAIAGNTLKAFPGIGTITGGIVHAVAYGLLFDSLGRAIADTLASRGTLPMNVTLQSFEERLSEDLESRARNLVRLAIGQDQRADRARNRR